MGPDSDNYLDTEIDINNSLETENIEGAVGAYVAYPKVGIHEYVGVIDINSLYPSTIRALNMGVETIMGQLKPTYTEEFVKEKFKTKGMTYAKAWEGQFGSIEYQYVMAKRKGIDITVEWEGNGKNDIASAEDIYQMIFQSNKKWLLSGNGTIFSYERAASPSY